MKIASSITCLALAACGGGGGSDSDSLLRGCSPIAGGATQVTSSVSPTCAGCSVSTPQQVADGNGATFATLAMPGGAAGTVTLRSTAQNGVVFSSGSLAGMVHSISYGTSAGLVIELVTFMGGTEQERFNFNSGAGSAEQDPSAPGRASFATSAQYDAVELSFTRASGSGTVEARVHEFCSN